MDNVRKFLWASVIVILAFHPLQAVMTMEDYLRSVEQKNPEIVSADFAIRASQKKTLELDLVYSPLFTADYNFVDDKSGFTFTTVLPATEIKATQWDFGASKKFSTGSTVSIGYSSLWADFNLLTPVQFGSDTLQNFTGYQFKPFIQLEQSLLRDFFSGLTQSGIDKSKAAARAGQYAMLFKKQQALLQARAAYWSLSLAREVLNFRKVSLDRTQRIMKWNEKKVAVNLAENVDLLQARAAYKLHALNLQLAREDVLKAQRDFNQYLGIKSDQVNEDIEQIADKVSFYQNVAELSRTGTRSDVLSARLTFESARFAEKETKYRSMPELTFSGSYSLTGLDLTPQAAWDQITNYEKPTYSLGLALAVPLDYGRLRNVKKGYALDFDSAREALASAEINSSNDWEQLTRNWNNVKSRLALAQEIQQIQEQRVKEEQSRFERGKTTTFLLLTAQNDLDDATLNVYRLVFEEFSTAAQAELYNTQPF